MMLHAAHPYKAEFTDIAVHANDTDVLVLYVATASGLHGARLWLVFGPDKRYIPTHTITENQGDEMTRGLLLLHAVSRCNTVSSFSGIGKKTAFSVWKLMRHLVPVCPHLSQTPDMKELERFVQVHILAQ